MGQNIGQFIRHLTAGCTYQHTVQNSGIFWKMAKIFKIKKKNKMADFQGGGYSSGLYKKILCPQ